MPYGVLQHQLTWLWYGAERLYCALCSAYLHVHALLRHHVVHVHGTCAADLWLWCPLCSREQPAACVTMSSNNPGDLGSWGESRRGASESCAPMLQPWEWSKHLSTSVRHMFMLWCAVLRLLLHVLLLGVQHLVPACWKYRLSRHAMFGSAWLRQP